MSFERLPIADLRNQLETLGLNTEGNKNCLIQRLKDAENNTSIISDAQQEVNPEDSTSQVSAKSNSSSVVSANKAIECAKRAGLIAKLNLLKEKQKSDEIAMKAKQDSERLAIEAEIAEAMAKEKILEKYEMKNSNIQAENSEKIAENGMLEYYELNKSSMSNSNQDNNNHSQKLNPSANYFVSSQNISSNLNVNNNNLTSVTCDQNLMQSLVTFNMKSLLPKTEILQFSGDYTEYHAFIKSFDNVISNKLVSDGEKLLYLDQFTRGTARDIVRACLHMPNDTGYVEARKLLHERYGNIELVTNAYVDKVLSWPMIKNDDPENLDKYSLLLISARNAMSDHSQENRELEHPKTISKIIEKLPFGLQDRWRRIVHQLRENEGRFAGFSDMVKFISKEASIANHPVYGKKKLSANTIKNKFVNSNKSKTLIVSCNLVNENKENLSYKKTIKCIVCTENHYLDQCTSFKNKNIEDKIKIIKDNGFCYSCLGRGHLSKNCKRRRRCDKCQQSHPTLIHDYYNNTQSNEKEISSQENHTVLAKHVNTKESVKMPVVAVKVRAYDGSMIQTYALLDGGSTSSFCTLSLLEKINTPNISEAYIYMNTANCDSREKTTMVSGVTVCDFEENNLVELPPIYTLNKIPVVDSDVVKKDYVSKFPKLSHIKLYDLNSNVELLIGSNVPKVLEPWNVIHSDETGSPFAFESILGWVVSSNSSTVHENRIRTNKINASVDLDELLIKIYNQGFDELHSNKKGQSVKDKLFLEKVQESCKYLDKCHYEIPLPFEKKNPNLPNNKSLVMNRIKTLKNKFIKDSEYHRQYNEFMSEMVRSDHCELVPNSDLEKKHLVWYIPHFGVYHPKKPNKLRIVFDCSMKFFGRSLNEELLQGPDMVTPLLNVLLRFRTGKYAYGADIKQMFYQIDIPESDRDYTRFLWWENGYYNNSIREFRMKVYLFGATCSPSCATFALQKTADDNKDFSLDARNTIKNNFYVDDLLKSCDDEDELIKNAVEVKALCKRGGFHLNKYVSPSSKLLECVPDEDVAHSTASISFGEENSLSEKTLGLCWTIDKDLFSVQVINKNKPVTKRGILSITGSVYDPLGIVAPYVLLGKAIMQELCRLKLDWDDPIPENIASQWHKWISDLNLIQSVTIPRSFKPLSMKSLFRIELHHYADASNFAYATVSFVRIIDIEGNIHCEFLYGKTRVAPLKGITIPRLELTAASLLIKNNEMIHQALGNYFDDVYYWTDSQIVLKYIKNQTTRFQVFVANRISMIRENSLVEQWRYVPSELNPADDGSRGLQTERWLHGPDYLKQPINFWPQQDMSYDLKDDPEVKCNTISVDDDIIMRLILHYSDWLKLQKAVAWLLRIKNKLLKRSYCKNRNITVDEINYAHDILISYIQRKMYFDEYNNLINGKDIKISSNIVKLNPMMHNNLLRIGGRLNQSNLPFKEKHPILLPSKHPLTKLIIRYIHRRIYYQGREHTLSEIRKNYWIVRGSSSVRSVLKDCIQCKKHHGPVLDQIMSELPPERFDIGNPPFTNTGVDVFGPFYVKVLRSQQKRYGVMLTCLTTRAVHIEIIHSMDTSSFISALRRFIARRGMVKYLRSDRGTNMVSANKELQEEFNKLNENEISQKLLEKGIQWEFNPPYSSHHGGCWERMIRSARKILENIIRNSSSLTEEMLQTFMCEVEHTLNSRPLTTLSSDMNDLNPLTPNHILNLRGSAPSCIKYENVNQAFRSRWRHVQQLADEFWLRWKNDYMRTLQERNKWVKNKRNLTEGDIVLVHDKMIPRNNWLLGKVIKVYPSQDGYVRHADVQTINSVVKRPISKLVMIIENK